MLAAEEVGTELPTGDYLSQWLGHSRGRLRSKTFEGYEGVIRLYACPGIGEIPLSRLHPLHLQQLYSDLIDRGLAGGTVLNLHLVLAQALTQAVRWGLIDQSPAGGAQPPRPRRPEPVVVDPALASRILAAVQGTTMELPAVVGLATGMRRGEILALRWGDLDEGFTVAQVRRSLQVSGEGLHFVEPKTRRSRRSVALPEFLRPYLERKRADQETRRAACPDWVDLDLVIDAGDGSPRHPDTLVLGVVLPPEALRPSPREVPRPPPRPTPPCSCSPGSTPRWSRSAWAMPRWGSPWICTPTSFPPCRPRPLRPSITCSARRERSVPRTDAPFFRPGDPFR